MRRLAVCVVLLLSVSPASAAGPQVTDPAGDANGTGQVAPAPLSLAAFDITSVRWHADAATQRVTVTFAAAPGDGRFYLSWATPSCATNVLDWRSGVDFAHLAGCKPRHERWLKPPVVSGTAMTFAIPRRDLPSWLAAGTTLTRLGASAAPVVELHSGQLHPEADDAYADVKYVVGT